MGVTIVSKRGIQMAKLSWWHWIRRYLGELCSIIKKQCTSERPTEFMAPPRSKIYWGIEVSSSLGGVLAWMLWCPEFSLFSSWSCHYFDLNDRIVACIRWLVIYSACLDGGLTRRSKIQIKLRAIGHQRQMNVPLLWHLYQMILSHAIQLRCACWIPGIQSIPCRLCLAIWDASWTKLPTNIIQ